MGWSTFEERIDKSMIKYKLRLECMEENRWPKKVFNWREGKGVWNREVRKRLNKYNITFERRGYENIISINEEVVEGSNIKIIKKIEERVKNKGCNIWKDAMEGKETLKWYKNKKEPRWENYYDGSWEAKLFFKAKSESLEVNGRTYIWNVEDRIWWCEKCSNEEVPIKEDVRHLLLECEAYTNERMELESIIIQEIGGEEWRERKRSDDGGIKLILGIDERNGNIIYKTKEFLRKIWKIREEGVVVRLVRENDHNYY